jgi:hypothetical protein
MKKNKVFAVSIGLTLLLLLLTVKTVKPQNPSLPNQYKYGAIDKTGKYIIPPQFDNIQYFSEGLALVEVQGKTGYVDRTGKMVIPLFEGYAKSFSEGLAAAIKRGYKYGYKQVSMSFHPTLMKSPVFTKVLLLSELSDAMATLTSRVVM